MVGFGVFAMGTSTVIEIAVKELVQVLMVATKITAFRLNITSKNKAVQ